MRNLKIRKYVRTSGNGGNAHNIFIFQLKTVYLNILLYANFDIPPPHLENPENKNMICNKTSLCLNINLYVILFQCICQMLLSSNIYIKTNKRKQFVGNLCFYSGFPKMILNSVYNKLCESSENIAYNYQISKESLKANV